MEPLWRSLVLKEGRGGAAEEVRVSAGLGEGGRLLGHCPRADVEG